MNHLTDILKTTTVNGTVLAVTWWSSILPVAQLILIGVTIFWTCLKVAKALRDLRK